MTTKNSILLVEDQHADLFADTLNAHNGLRFEIVMNGKEALDRAMAQPFDLILMDLRLPKLPGIEVIRLIRQSDGPNRETPIIAITAYTDARSRGKALENGANAYVVKPPNFNTLYRMVLDLTVANTNIGEDSKRVLNLQRRLNYLKERKAYMGIHTPPYILMEIEDIKQELEDK